MVSHIFILLLALGAASAGECACRRKPQNPTAKIYNWTLSTTRHGMVQTKVTSLDKSLADDIPAYLKCYQEEFNKLPNDEEYKYNKEAYGRKKRDLTRSMWSYGQEIPFLISANYSLCAQRRLALAIRKFEERTCIKFVPFEGLEKHDSNVLMIHNIWNDDSPNCIANSGQIGIKNSFLDGNVVPAVGSASIKDGCERAFEHEMMHVLGFIHPQDSPFREGPADFWKAVGFPIATRKIENTVQITPWERNSATSYIATDGSKANYLTDWDVYKINQVFGCKTTAYGNKPIDMNNKPAPVVNDFKTINRQW